MTLGRKWSPYHQANLYSALSDTFQNQLFPGGQGWQSVTFHNFQTPLPQKSTVFCCVWKGGSSQKGWIFHKRHVRSFHRSTRTRKKGTKNSKIINAMIYKLQTGILALWSNTMLMLSPGSLSTVTQHGILGEPRPHHNYFRKSSICWRHQERRHEVLLLCAVRLLSPSRWHVWMSENLSWEPRIIFKNKERRSQLPPFQASFWDILLVVFALSTKDNNNASCMLTTLSLGKENTQILHFYKTWLKKNSISNSKVTRSTDYQKSTLHLASPLPSAFCDWTVEASRFFAALFPSLPPSAFPFLPLGSFSPFFAGAFLGRGSGFGGAGLADKRADLLCGSSFTFPLSPLASPLAFLLGMVAAALGRWLGQSREGGGFCLPHTAPRKISFSFHLTPKLCFLAQVLVWECSQSVSWAQSSSC